MLREKRLEEELEAQLDFARKRIEIELIKQEEKQQEADEFVRQLKAEAKSFITRENIDQAIENALNNPVDYNFALTPNGEKIFGRETTYKEDKQKISVKQ